MASIKKELSFCVQMGGGDVLQSHYTKVGAEKMENEGLRLTDGFLWPELQKWPSSQVMVHSPGSLQPVRQLMETLN